MSYIQGTIGFLVILALAWLLSEDKKKFPARIVISGILLQIILALLLIKIPLFRTFFQYIQEGVLALQHATQKGAGVVFGYLSHGPIPFKVTDPSNTFVLAFKSLPLILVISALSALLFHWRVLQPIVRGFSWALKKAMGIGGVVGVGTAANIFVGMVESPLLIRPYINRISRGELFMIMTGGMATVAGTMMVIYATILQPVIGEAMGHILTASIISAPASLVIASLMVPMTEAPTTGDLEIPYETRNSMDAITKGTSEGIQLIMHVIAMIIVLVALVSLVNIFLNLFPNIAGEPLTLQRIMGYILAPIAWLMGIPWDQALTAGSLFGTKTILNEFLAYIELSQLPASALSEKSRLIMTYALCGFANPGSLGIMIGGLGAMAPERKNEIISLGLKSIVAGTLATTMTGTLFGLMY